VMENIKLCMCISFLPVHLCMPTCSRSIMHTHKLHCFSTYCSIDVIYRDRNSNYICSLSAFLTSQGNATALMLNKVKRVYFLSMGFLTRILLLIYMNNAVHV